MWMIFGPLALLIVLINLINVLNKKTKYITAFIFASLSFGVIAILECYKLVNEWVVAGDMSALMDVVPTMTNVLTIIAYIGIILNGLVLFIHSKNLNNKE